jgi:ankyrin repeat protein
MAEFDKKVNKALKLHAVHCVATRMSSSRIYDRNLTDTIMSFLDFKTPEYIITDFAKAGNLEMVQYLAEQGVSTFILEDALYLVANYGHLSIVKYLFSLDMCTDAMCNRALVESVKNGHLDVMKYLIKRGVRGSVRDGSALCCAAGYGHLDIVEYLVELEPVPVQPYQSSVRCAMLSGHKQIAAYLQNRNK